MKLNIFVFLLCSVVSLSFAVPESGISEITKRPENGSNVQLQPSQDKVKINLLELVSGVGKAIHLMLNHNTNSSSLLNQRSTSIVSETPVASNGSLTSSASSVTGTLASSDIRAAREKEENSKRAEELRVEIARRAASLQKIVGSAIEVMRDRGDVVVRRILEHLNTRLDQARTNADKILKEPATSEMAVRTLNTINQGLNGVNQMIHNVLYNYRITKTAKKSSLSLTFLSHVTINTLVFVPITLTFMKNDTNTFNVLINCNIEQLKSRKQRPKIEEQKITKSGNHLVKAKNKLQSVN